MISYGPYDMAHIIWVLGTKRSYNLEKSPKEEEIEMYLNEGWINDNGWVKLEDFITKAMLYCQILIILNLNGLNFKNTSRDCETSQETS